MTRIRNKKQERPVSTIDKIERALLVGVEFPNTKWPINVSLDELERLTQTAGAEVVDKISQKLEKPNPRTFIGSGKVQEIASIVKYKHVNVVIFDDELTPSQQAKLEEELKPAKVIDRTALILDIFGRHAHTRAGKLQVQLAQLEYIYPRLRGMWSHLMKERTGGGIGSRFGQGETQLEVDRRLIRNKISKLKDDIKKLDVTRRTQRKSRWSSSNYKVALAGYTNAGKSTLLNKLTGSNVFSHDMLFATLDPTTRILTLPEGRELTITDTVGFIQKLPTNLIDSFKSTLAEVMEADLIAVVIDASSDERDAQLNTVQEILDDLNTNEIPKLYIYNKSDLLSKEQRKTIEASNPMALCVSALTGEGIDKLIEKFIYLAALKDKIMTVLIPFDRGDLVGLAHERCRIDSEKYTAEGTHLVIRVPESLVSEFSPYSLNQSHR